MRVAVVVACAVVAAVAACRPADGSVAFGGHCDDDAVCAEGLVCLETPRFDVGCGDTRCSVACQVEADCAAFGADVGCGCDGACFVPNNGFE